jgi:hypothetical protein
MTLFDDLIPLKQELLGIPTELGHPDYLRVSVTHDEVTYEFTARRTNLSYTQQQWLANANIRVNNDMLPLIEIPRSVPLEILQQGIYSVGTHTYRAVNTDIASSLTYRSVLSKVRNR